MSLTAFFSNDTLSASQIAESSPGSPYAPVSNANDPRPRKVYQVHDDGCFEVSTTNRYIDLKEDAGPSVTVVVTVPVGIYQSRASLAQAITQAINQMVALTQVYYVDWVSGRFRISNVTGSAPIYDFSLLWKTGTHGSDNADDSMAGLLGYTDTSDDGPGLSFTANNERYSTHTYIRWALDKSLTPNLVACQLGGDNLTDFDTVNVYMNSTNLGNRREIWAAAATHKLEFSARPSEDENRLQVAYPTSPSAVLQVFFSWEHIDSSQVHEVGLVAGLVKVGSTTQAEGSSATRTLAQLSGHGLFDDADPLGVNTYYPAQTLKRWRTPLAFDSWELADYRAVVHELVRLGRSTPMVWALNWTTIFDGTLNAEDEADKGLLFWGALAEYSLDDYQGATSAYISGTLAIEQVR